MVARSRVPTQPHFPGVCHWASEPTGRQAAESPSRRAAERASARNSSPPRPHRPQGPLKPRPANAKSGQRRVPAFASSHRPLTHTLGHLQWPEPPRFADATTTSPAPFWRAIALARSDHPAATGESDPSVTLPRTSPPAIVWYQQAPIIQSDPAIGVTDTSASRAWVHVGQPAPKTALKASHKALYRPEECLGSHGARPRQRGLVTNRHKSSCHVTILRFWPAISEPGWARRKKVSLGVLLRRTRPSHGRVCSILYPPEARQNFRRPGLSSRMAPVSSQPSSETAQPWCSPKN